MQTRRHFLTTSALAFVGLQRMLANPSPNASKFGDLIIDPKRILDLPKGFTYRVLSKRGDIMDDGFKVPGQPDGMAAFQMADGKIVLVRNHELSLEMEPYGPYQDNLKLPDGFDRSLCYDANPDGTLPHIGGTTNLVFDPVKGEKVSEFLSLTGTLYNCAGGKMPWGAWITCEEGEEITEGRGKNHGWCFEVKATTEMGIQKPTPLKALGRFRHEAVTLDPKTGILYLTEDRNDGIFYRFLPDKVNDFTSGKLQALQVVGKPEADLRNYSSKSTFPKLSESFEVTWIDLEDTHSPNDDLRFRGHKSGAAVFSRAEGIDITDDGIFIACTDGGFDRHGQIFRLKPSGSPEKNDSMELFIECNLNSPLINADNLCPAPNGGLVVCEDLVDPSFAERTHLRWIKPDGSISTFARNAKDNSEFAGCCFSPDGKWLFVNLQSRGLTLAITGPWT